MAHSAVLQNKQDMWLAGQIAGRAIPVEHHLIPRGADVLIPTNTFNNQLSLHRPLSDVRGLGPAVFMGVAMDYSSTVFQPNSLLNGVMGAGLYDSQVI